METNAGYAEAKRLLNEHFGDPYCLSTAYIQKSLNWNAIKSEDDKELHSYALYLRSCCNIARDLPDMTELDTPSNLKLISKLPYKLRGDGESKHVKYRRIRNDKPDSIILWSSFEKQARILLDPVFGSIQDSATVLKA